MLRTDLAQEARELWAEEEGGGLPPGVTAETAEEEGTAVEILTVASPEGAAALGKPQGVYVRVEIESTPDPVLSPSPPWRANSFRLRLA